MESVSPSSKVHSLYDRLAELEEKKRKFQEDLSRLETELLTQIDIVEPEAYIAFIKHLTEHFENATPQIQRRLLRSVIQKIIVHKDQIEAYYFVGKDWIFAEDPSALPRDDNSFPDGLFLTVVRIP